MCRRAERVSFGMVGKAVIFLLLQRVFFLQIHKTRATIAGSFTVAKVFQLS